MNLSEYYFAGQLKRLGTYLALIRFFIYIESFLISRSPALICHIIFDKLAQLLLSQKQHHGEIALHLILLYKNYTLIPQDKNLDAIILERIILAWSLVIRAQKLRELESNQLLYQAKGVLLSLQDRVINLLNDNTIRNRILNKSLRQILNTTDLKDLNWVKHSTGCYSAGEYFFNLFKGTVFYKGYPLDVISDELLNHPDYRVQGEVQQNSFLP